MFRLHVEQIGKRFGRRILFRRLSFVLEGGTSLAITGSNGSGKSTLVQIIAGLQRASKGEVALHMNDHAVPVEERPFYVGLVAPYLNVYDGFSAYENLAFVAQARSLPHAEDRIAATLERVGLADRANDLVKTFSSGMKQRVRFAVALLPEPPLLLLDEPTSNLDDPGRAMVAEVMAHQLSTERLLIVATNDADEAAQCDDVIRVESFR